METTNEIDILFEGRPSAVARDLKLNLKRLMENGLLDPSEATLALAAVATSAGAVALADYAKGKLETLDFTKEQIEEASESAAIMGMLNTYYRFRHMLAHSQPESAELYKNTSLRMTALAKPLLGKQRFEMLAFAVSVLNGCETCISNHEKALRESGVIPEKIHDLARLAAVVKGVAALGI